MIVLDRIFIDNELYFDAIKLFNSEISEVEFNDKYNYMPFEKGYLYKETGLLKEDELDA